MEEQNKTETEKFKTYLKAKQLGERTIQEYLSYYALFEPTRLNQDYLTYWTETHNNIVARAFLKNYLHFRKINAGTREEKLLIAELEIPKITGRKKKRLKEFVSREDVMKIFGKMKCQRDKIMLLVDFYGGLRISELMSIKPYSFKWKKWLEEPDNAGELVIIGKGDKQRKVFIPSEVMALLYTWIKKDVVINQSKEEPLWNISDSTWQRILSRASKSAIDKHISTHSLRRGIATYLKEKGWQITDVANYLGHQSISTTQIYLGSSSEKLREKFEDTFKQKT